MQQSLAKGFAYLTSASFVSVLIQIIKGKLMAVFLGAAGMGVYSQLSNFFNLFFTLSSLGFRNGIIKKVSFSIAEGDELAIKQHYASVFIFLSAISIVAVCFASLLASPLSNFLFSDSGEKSYLVVLTLLAVPSAILANFYRALLSGYMAIRAIVKAQIVSDVISLIPFVLFLYYWGLMGAVSAFAVYQFLKMMTNAIYFYRTCGSNIGIPKISDFKLVDIATNMRFGLSGLFLGSLNVILMIMITRHLIVQLGEETTGYYAVAIKVSTVYLGAIYANASSYYFPILVKCKDSKELSESVNHTGRFYLYLLPPIIIVVMTGGDLMVRLLFSAEFLPAAMLLLLFLPGDLLRINAETFALPLLASEKFIAYNTTYIFWAVCYAALAFHFVEQYGIVGIGIAYLVSHFINLIIVVLLVNVSLQVVVSKSLLVSFFLATAFIGISSISNFLLESFWTGVFFNAIVLMAWFAFSCLQKDFVSYVYPLWMKIRRAVYAE